MMDDRTDFKSQPSTPTSASPFVSVIIPVLNDALRLKQCLRALEQQTYPQSGYEIIVVDNGSDDDAAVAAVVAEFERAIVIHEAFPSSFAARNTGIAIAAGEIIAFTDADCIPALDWIEQGVRHLLSLPNCGFVGGRVEVFFQHPDRPTPVELYERITAFPQQRLVEQHGYAATANLFTLKSVLDRAGEFDANLKSSGDIEWGQRVAALGYIPVYAEHAWVDHPARRSLAQLHKRSVRLAGGLYDLLNYGNCSFWQRNICYAITLVKNLVPPVNFAVHSLLNTQLPSLQQKLQVSLVMVLVRYVSAGELIRLKLGGASTRD